MKTFSNVSQDVYELDYEYTCCMLAKGEYTQDEFLDGWSSVVHNYETKNKCKITFDGFGEVVKVQFL